MTYYLGLFGLFCAGFFLALILCAVMSATRNADHDVRVQEMGAEIELWRGRYELCYARAAQAEDREGKLSAALDVLRKERAAERAKWQAEKAAMEAKLEMAHGAN